MPVLGELRERLVARSGLEPGFYAVFLAQTLPDVDVPHGALCHDVVAHEHDAAVRASLEELRGWRHYDSRQRFRLLKEALDARRR